MDKVKTDDDEARIGSPVTIGRAAAAAGLTPRAVRLYEARGLLPTPVRTGSGYRVYGPADVARMRFIAAARRLGLHIDQVAEILVTANEGQRPCGTARAILDRRIAEIDDVVRELTDLRSALLSARDTSAESSENEACLCPMIEHHL